ncbi:HAD family hydrolase [Synechococcus sp. MIT S1220]|uniref:HAD family hydrolase n=1 Tax=Synechococcus sp. MIT S1220 TaxID=3082549 RepID=UPI0039B00CAD
MVDLLFKGDPIGAIEGVLFDKDGTLSHSEPHLLNLAEARINSAIELWVAGGRPESVCPPLRENLKRAFGVMPNGLDPAGTLAVASRHDNLTSMATVFCLMECSWPAAHQMATDSFNRVDRALTQAPAIMNPLLPGSASLIQQLFTTGIKLAVISNDTEQGIQRFLEGHGLCQSFQTCWSAEHFPAKPNPEAVAQLCNKLDLDPKVCALIGDAETDLQMAAASGIGLVIGYTGGWTSKPHLPSAALLIDDWNELSIQVGT